MASSSPAPVALIRFAKLEDLPAIHVLIRESFDAVLDHYPHSLKPFLDHWFDEALQGDLPPSKFAAEYLTGAADASKFWVAEDAGGSVLGCVALRRAPGLRDEGELVRMAVSKSLRGGGIGARIVAQLIAFCEGPGAVLRVTFTTTNPGAASFYTKKCGFVVAKESDIPFGHGLVVHLTRAVRYLGERVVRRIAIVGGTHGNERLGVELVEQWKRDPTAVSRETLQVFTWIGNPAAVEKNVRFIDVDLNRQFAAGAVTSDSAAATGGAAASLAVPLEQARAAALRALVAEHRIDFIIDLHSTNADVGLVVMVPAGEANVAAMRVAAALQASGRPERGPVRVTCTSLPLAQNWSVDAAAPAGLSIEVGPLPHGTLSSGLLEATRRLVLDALDALDARNRALLAAAAAGGSAAANPDVIPATAAPALVIQPSPRPELEAFTHVASVPYPAPDARPGSPRWLVHPSLEGPNWRPIADGDPAFISASGSGEVRTFAAPVSSLFPTAPPAPVTGLHTLFVNEAAYQASGTAFAVYKRGGQLVY